MLHRLWIATGPNDWNSQSDYSPLRIVDFADKLLHDKVEMHEIESVSVSLFG